MSRLAYDRYRDPKLFGAFRSPELGDLNPALQQRVKNWDTEKDQYFVEFTGTYSLTEVQLLLREYNLRDYPNDVSLLRKLPEGHIKSDVIRFWYNIELHYQLPYAQLISKQELWRRTFDEGASFANWLDDLFCYAYRNAYGTDFISPDEFCGIRLENYSSLFPPCYLPRIEEEIFDMRKWMVDAPIYNERIRREILHEIEKIVRNCSKLYIPHFEDIIASIKDTVCYYDGIKYKPYQLALHQHCELRSDYVGYETKILVYPSGMRDAVILEKGSSNMIRICEKIFLSIIDSCEESLYGLSGDRLRESLNFFKEQEEGYHVLRDIKKCGLTVPINIYIDDIQEILYRYFPGGPWNALDIYKNIKIKLMDDTWLYPKRGAGLGMANNLTTLLCIAAHRLAKRYFYRHKDHSIYITGRIGNDDSDVYVRGSLQDARDYLLYERDILSDAGFVVNLKKTYISRYYHLFEEYQHENFIYKESLAIGMLVKSLLEKNLRTAKYMAIEAQKLAPTLNVYEIIESIAVNRRYEFDRGELNRPFWLGGWVYKRLDGKYLGLDSLGTALLYSRKEVYRAARVIHEFHRMITSMKDHEILTSHDNANYVWRRAGFTGEACKGYKGFYNYSLSENYRNMITMWTIKNVPIKKIKILNSLYKKKYESGFSKVEYATFLVKSGNFYNDISLSAKYMTLYETPSRHYQIPLKVPFKSSEAAYVSKRLAGMLEALPKCISELSYASEYYPIFQYDSVLTTIDPQGRRNYLRDQGLISGNEKIIEPFDVIDECAHVEEILGRFNIILYPVRKEWLFQRFVSNAYAYLMKDGERQDDALVIEREEFSNFWSFLHSDTIESEHDSSVIEEEFWFIANGGDPEDFIKRLKSPEESENESLCSTIVSEDTSVENNLPMPDLSDLWQEEEKEFSSTCLFEDPYESTEISETYSSRHSLEIRDSENDVSDLESFISHASESMEHYLDMSTTEIGDISSSENVSEMMYVETQMPLHTYTYSLRRGVEAKDNSDEVSSEISEVREEPMFLDSSVSENNISCVKHDEYCERLSSVEATEILSLYDRDRDADMCPIIFESIIDTSEVWVQIIRRSKRFFLMSNERIKEELIKDVSESQICSVLQETSIDTSDVWVSLIRREHRFFLMSKERVIEELKKEAHQLDELAQDILSETTIVPEVFQSDGESYLYVDDNHLKKCLTDFENFKGSRSEDKIRDFANTVHDFWYEMTYGRKDFYPVDRELLNRVHEQLIELHILERSEEQEPVSIDVPWLWGED